MQVQPARVVQTLVFRAGLAAVAHPAVVAALVAQVVWAALLVSVAVRLGKGGLGVLMATAVMAA